MKFRLLYSIVILLISILFFLGCKTKINQVKNNLPEGKWVMIDTLEHENIYITKGKFHKGKEIGTWKYTYNGKLDRKEKYKNGQCFTKFYYPNGKLMKKGYTQFEDNVKEAHWFYTGDWNYFNENGQLVSIKTFDKGKMLQTLHLTDSITGKEIAPYVITN